MISDHVMNLKEFEKRVGDDVTGVYELTMKAGGEVRGVPLTLVKAMKITTPTPYSTKKTSKSKAETDAEPSEGDSCEEEGEEEVASDMEDDVLDVDTDSDKKSFDESGNSLSEASISSDDGPAKGGPGPAKGGPGPATGPASSGPAGGIAHYGRSGPRIWSNGYFYIKGNTHFLIMHIHEEFTAATALGSQFRSKTISPHTIGETRDLPTKTVLCLKAWMLWRAHSVAGWVDRVPARQRLFAETEQELYLAVQRLQPQADGLLGNEFASRMLVGWAPGVVTRLRG